MALLAEYALTPGVFDATCYNSDEVCGLHLQRLKEVLLDEGLVRDLRGGGWGKSFLVEKRPCHPRGKELLKKLVTQKRLVASSPALQRVPDNDSEWCDEALASHTQRAVAGIVTTDATAAGHIGAPFLSSVSRLTNAAWWTSRSPSIQLGRTFTDYSGALELVLRHSNSLMFVDPYVDPTDHYQYGSFLRLLETLATRGMKPVVEIHRAAWYGAGNDRRPRIQEVVQALQPRLSAAAQRAGVPVEVFLWDDIHDRFIISDLIGISLPYGLGTTTQPGADTVWTRLGRSERDAIQRKYDPAFRTPRHRFSV